MFQPIDVFERVLPCVRVEREEFLGLFSGQREPFGHRTEQFHHLSQVIVRLAIALLLALSRLEKEVGRDKLENHACKAPHVSRRIIIYA